jgi:hypothetical protein
MSRHFVTTWPRRGRCPQCGRLVLDGIEEGLPYRVTPIPLTLHGELAARLAGAATYRLIAGTIVRRTPEDTAAETPGTRPPVYAWHRCASVDPHHISIAHIPATQRLITNRNMNTSTPERDTDQQRLITLVDVLNGHVTESPDDEAPPF